MRIGRLDVAAVIGELRHLHETAEDRSIDQMPSDEELYGALLYLEANSGALKSQEARRTAALRRVQLWEYIREQADIHQGKAIDDARQAAAAWSDLAPVLAVRVPSAAYNKAMRLRAAVISGSPTGEQLLRRTPEAVLEAEKQAELKAAANRRAAAEAARRHTLLAPVARRLIECRQALDDDDEVTFWLDQVEAVLPDCRTPTQLVSLETYVRAVARELRKSGRSAGHDSPMASDAQLAVAAAVELIGGD
ncbi:hypothetical protein [Streptomyces fructofermentans]|uniref:hypothetical protein n=1 Tax=Streptomyces fructofermentans TaxID=152141 RepID=UPI003401F7A4